ncbi:hypothetical protein AX14_013179 [Amanita brunnescens Koide BX004]|nr:hypothetical protein AX14_013179 [Amanita brunnescens Koide BX004]
MSHRKGKGPPTRPRAEFSIFSEDVATRLPHRLRDDGQTQLIQTFKSACTEAKRPLRPGYGQLGNAIMLRTNFFPVRLPKGPFWDYTVTIKEVEPEGELQRSGKGKERDTGEPAAKSGGKDGPRITAPMKRRIFGLLEKDPSFEPYRAHIAHDYSQRIIAAKQLPQPLDTVIRYVEEDEEHPRDDAKLYSTTVEFVGQIDVDTLLQYTNGDVQYRDHEDLQRIISAINLIMQQHASRTGRRLGKQEDNGASKFFFGSSGKLVPGVELWKGFFTSARPVFKQLMINVNACYTAFFEPGNLAQALIAFGFKSSGAIPRDVSFANIRVKTLHTGYKKRVVTVGTTSARRTSFYWEELKKKVSVAEYIETRYDITLQHADDLPVVSIGMKRGKDGREEHSWVPAEVCEILEGNPRRGRLTPPETKAMIRSACRPPWENAEAIVNKGLPSLGLTQDTSSLDAFGISIDPNMAVIPGRVLIPPKVAYPGRTLTVQNGAWNLIGSKFQRGARVDSWWYIHVRAEGKPNASENEVSTLADRFKNKAKEIGVLFADVRPISLTSIVPPPHKDSKSRSQALSIIRNQLGEQLAKTRKPSFVLVLLDRKDDAIYSGIKRIGDVELGIHTNHMVLENGSNKSEQYLANVALKLNVKLGGKNHVLDNADMQWFRKKKTMLVGIDVTHAGPGSKAGTPSIAAVVASIDDTFVQFPASLRIQKHFENKEMLDELKDMMCERLLSYKKHNSTLPERIVVFRDGVSDGQFDDVLTEELTQITGAFQRLSAQEKKYNPELVIIVCGKRHHTKLFPTTRQDADMKGNTRPGTVVDRGVTSVFDFDFYLQAHAGIQGTVKSTHYTVVYDGIGLGADEVQKNTNSASYMYARATRSVSLVPPAYYADLACERGRCYLQEFLVAGTQRSARSVSDTEKERVYEEAGKCWGNGLHNDIKDTMFYI